MKTLKKDLFLLFIYSIHNTITYIWPIIYPYLSSYLIQKNSSLSMKKIFSTTIGMFFGTIIGSIICSRFYFFFGIKKSMQIGGVILFANYILYFYISNFIGICLNIILSGAISQMGILSVSYFLSEKYENGHLYCNYVYIGTNIANFFWPFICVILINPDNHGMTEFINGEYYFPAKIGRNFPLLMIVIGITSSLIIFFTTFFLEDPDHIKPNFIPWITAVFYNNKRALKELETTYKEQSMINLSKTINSNNSISLNLSQDKNSDEENSINELLTKNSQKKFSLTYEEAEEISKKIIYNKFFILFVFLMALRWCPMLFMIDNYKIISFNILKNDKLISLALSISSLISILGQIMIGPIWKYFDFFKSHLILFFLLFVTMIVFLFFAEENVFIMFWILSFNRVIIQMSCGSVYLTTFGLFNQKVAILITRIMDSYKFIALVIIILLNFLFDVREIFWVLLILNVLGIIGFFYFFKNFKQFIKEIEIL